MKGSIASQVFQSEHTIARWLLIRPFS